MKYGWPGKKRTYHTGKKRCRYLKDMRADFAKIRQERIDDCKKNSNTDSTASGKRGNHSRSGCKRTTQRRRDNRGREIIFFS